MCPQNPSVVVAHFQCSALSLLALVVSFPETLMCFHSSHKKEGLNFLVCLEGAKSRMALASLELLLP